MGQPRKTKRNARDGLQSPKPAMRSRSRQLPHLREDAELKRLLKALSDPLRLRILAHLASAGRQDVTSIAEACKASIVQASKSLALLRDLDLVNVASVGNRRIYAVTGRTRQRQKRDAEFDLQILSSHHVVLQITRPKQGRRRGR